MSSSKLYQFQEWLEGKVAAVLPEGVEVICRRKGDVENDIQNALSTLGIAVVIEPPLPLAWAKTYILKAETVESEIHILENVMLQNTQETAYSLLEKLAKSLHEERCDELGGAVITLGSVRDESPADEPVLHFVLSLTNALNL